MAIQWGLFDANGGAEAASGFEEAQQQRTRRGALSMYATDPQGAVNSALAGGDLQAAQGMSQMRAQTAQSQLAQQKYAAEQATQARAVADAEQAKHWGHVSAAAQQLDAVRQQAVKAGKDPNAAIMEAFDAYAPTWQSAAGWTPEEITQSRAALAANPSQGLDAIKSAAQQKLEFRHVGEGYDLALDPTTGRVIQEYNSPTVKVGDSLYPNPARPGGGPAAAAPAAPAPSGGAYDRMASIADQKGATPEETDYLRRTLRIESHGNPAAQNGSSTGLFQFHPDTFASVMPGGNIADPNDQVQATINLARRDQARLQKLGVDPTPANTYIMHQQGPGGGPALLTAPPEVNAISALTPVYGNASMARRAILGNGGTADMTAGEFVNMWRQKFDGAPAAAAAAPAAGGVSPLISKPKDDTTPIPFGTNPELDKRFGIPKGTIGYFDGKTKEPHYAPEGQQANDAPQLTPDAIDVAANMFRTDKKMPSVGMGKQGAAMRVLVMNRVAELMKINGETVSDINDRSARLRADTSSLQQLTKTADVINAAEATATKAADFVVAGISGGGGTKFPMLNKALIAGKRATGDPSVDVYISRLGTFADEYAKVIAGGTGNAPATDSVRKDAQRRINEAAAPDQLKAVIDSMKQEMQFRSESLRTGIDTIHGRIQSVGGGAGRAAPQRSPLAAPAQATPAALRTFHQLGREGKYNYAAPIGSENHPYIASEAQANKLRKGAHVIIVGGEHDGSLVRVD